MAKQAGLLSLLVTNAGSVVRREVLEDQLWEGRRVSDSALRVTASRLREQLRDVVGEDPIVVDRNGFRLELEPTLIDAVAYERLVAEADRLRWTGDARRAAALVDDAEALWRGPAYDGTYEPRRSGPSTNGWSASGPGGSSRPRRTSSCSATRRGPSSWPV